MPGTYNFVVAAPGFGHFRFTETFAADEVVTLNVPLRRNIASTTNGASITGDGINLKALIDDTESTNWASLDGAGTASEGKPESQQVEGRRVVGPAVTVELGDAAQRVESIQVSSQLRPTDGNDVGGDTRSQSRFLALRSFDVFSCDETAADCSSDAGYQQIFSSADDAFPGDRPRPTSPTRIIRPFDVTDTMATHVRVVVRDNQCTGAPNFQGEANPDNDPAFNPDCDTTATSPDRAVLVPPVDDVRAAEIQVFSQPAAVFGDGGNDPNPQPVIPEAPSAALLAVLGAAVAGYAVWRRREHAAV